MPFFLAYHLMLFLSIFIASVSINRFPQIALGRKYDEAFKVIFPSKKDSGQITLVFYSITSGNCRAEFC